MKKQHFEGKSEVKRVFWGDKERNWEKEKIQGVTEATLVTVAEYDILWLWLHKLLRLLLVFILCIYRVAVRVL